MSAERKFDVRDPEMLDRLVDGELTDAEERAVIAHVSQLPDGWRRCALAFLEARCWQRAARQVRELSAAPSPQPRGKAMLLPPSQDAPAGSSSAERTLRWPGMLALCALFLLAFGVGSLLPNAWNRLAGRHPALPVRPSQPVIHDHLLPAASDALASQGGGQGIDSQGLLLGNVTLVDNSGRSLEVPVYDWNQEVAEQLMYRAVPLSPDVLQQLKRLQVRSHRSYVPVRLQDGRQVVVPVHEVEVVPVGGTAY